MGTPEQHASFHLGLTWSEAVPLLSRLITSPAPLDGSDRDRLLAAAAACRLARTELETAHERHSLLRLAAPLYSEETLGEALLTAERALVSLSQPIAGAERFMLASGRLHWLFEFLSDTCNLLLRDVARGTLPRAAS
ncbi:MAG TPA: hypothetical protein V6D00_02685 [Pantanalinema sp.]